MLAIFCSLAPFILQMILIGFDEIHFHVKRGLPKWERIGHPLDTATVLLCFLFCLIVPYSKESLPWFIGFGVFSSLFITKDEFVHKHHCPGAEQWLHALLFVNHPIMITSLGLLWPFLHGKEGIVWLKTWMEHSHLLYGFILTQMLFVLLFMSYQILYWNFIWRPNSQK